MYPGKGRRVSMTGVTFRNNTADQGGAVFVEKTAVNGISVSCRCVVVFIRSSN